MADPLGVSFVIATRNRRDVLLETAAQIDDCGLDRSEMEIHVVDNASTDGTVAALGEHRPDVRVLSLAENRGSCAKTRALPYVRFRYVVHLDDDSWPIDGSIPRMVERFERTPSLASAGFVAHLPDGRIECSALPGVFIGCGVGLRTDLLRRLGGIDEWFFMQAEEYDLAFRLANAGYRVGVFDDLHVRHLKTPQARYGGSTAYYDVRNNVVLACRFLPDPWRRIYLADWVQRYAWLSRSSDNVGAFIRGAAAGAARAARERLAGRVEPLSARALQRFFCLQRIEAQMAELGSAGVRRILLAYLGKNVYAFWRGAKLVGLELVAIADDRFADPPGRRYRDTPILPTPEALDIDHDAVVVANTSYAHAAVRAQELVPMTDRPVHDWFGRSPDAAATQDGTYLTDRATPMSP